MSNAVETETPMRSGPMHTIALIGALILGGLLIFSGFTKLLSPKAFVAAVEAYRLIPTSWLLPATTGLVGLEFALGVMLVLGFARRKAAWIALPMVTLFVVMILRAMRLGIDSCGCFGEVIKMTPSQELVLDAVMLGLIFLVLRWGEDLRVRNPLVAPTVGWATLALGAALFLAGGPSAGGVGELSVVTEDLQVLQESQPALDLPDEAFLFFFSADCDHCWAYAGGVELMHQRVEGLEVHGITFSDPAAVESFREAFQPTYPLHVLDYKAFTAMVPDYPAAIWVQGGQIAETWSGFVPGHRQIAESGGYLYRPQSSARQQGASPFGGTVSGRH